MTVRGLLDQPRLQLTLVSGTSGVDREITWAHASDLPDPWNWLGPGELLLTNGTGIGSSPSAQVHFLERLSQIGASGLVIGLGTGGQPVTAELAVRAGDLELPVLTVPYSVRFADIVRVVAESDDREHSTFLGDVAHFYDVLRLSLAAGDLGPATFDALGRRLGLRLYLADAETGLSVFDDTPIPLGVALARAVAEHGHAIPGLLRLTRENSASGEVGALAVAVPGEPMTALVVEPMGDRLPSSAILQHIAIAGAVQLAQIVSQRQRQRRQGGELLDQLLDQRPARQVATGNPGATELDLAECVLAVLRPQRPGTDDDLHLACSRAHVPILLLQRDDLLYLVLPESAIGSHLLTWLAELGCPAGVSGPLGSGSRMPDASVEAVWALGIADANQLPLSRYGDSVGLLMPRTPTEAAALVDEILGELLEYDQVHQTHYLETVRAVVQADGSWQRAAAAVHIHKQTLGYRMRKIEGLTGRGFARTQHLAEWWFALQALELLPVRRELLERSLPLAAGCRDGQTAESFVEAERDRPPKWEWPVDPGNGRLLRRITARRLPA